MRPNRCSPNTGEARGRPDFDLRKFVESHFTPPPAAGGEYHTVPGQDVREHIDALWKVLERKPEDQRPYSSRLALPHRYVVPGGRFSEIYYWDSYFTMLGLQESGRHDLVDRHARQLRRALIDRYGHVPNGNRTYYLSRSQPPFFSAMVELVAQRDGGATLSQIPAAAASANMRSGWRAPTRLAPGQRASPRRAPARRHAAQSLLGRPRHAARGIVSRGHRDGARIGAAAAARSIAICARRRRAAGISARAGWPTARRSRRSARRDILPVDLNSLLFQLETTIAKACERGARCGVRAAKCRARGRARAAAIERYLWDTRPGHSTDYDWRARKLARPRLGGDALSALLPARRPRRRRARSRERSRAKLLQAAAGSRPRRRHRPAMGRAERLGAAAVDRHRRPAQLRPGSARRARSRSAGSRRTCRVYRSTGKLVEKYDVAGSGARRRRRRVSAAGRLRLDQRRAAQAARALSPAGAVT